MVFIEIMTQLTCSSKNAYFYNFVQKKIHTVDL
jgi:hypothetical protein